MQSIITIYTILVWNHPVTISVVVGQIPIFGSREVVHSSLSYIIQCKIVTPGAKSNLTPGAYFEQS